MSLDDWTPPVRPCVGSGMCCKIAPCPYGEVSPETGWCAHLIPWPDDDLDHPRYRCGRYEFIKDQPFAEMVPAFGGGCCGVIGNRDRVIILHKLRKREEALARAAEPPVQD